tara:strand:+ start:161400 stop:162050 length:651 start_codon:yes stop_codon:yes gene_type:complete
MMGIRFLVFTFLIFVSANLLAKDYGTFYVALAGGKTTNSASLSGEAVDFGDDPEIDFASDTGKYFILGKRLGKYLSAEIKLIDLGETGFQYDQYFDVERQTQLALFCLRFSIGWFHFKLGGGYASVKTDITDLGSSGTYNTSIKDEDENYKAALFSIGLNIPVTPGFILFFETNGLAWTQDDGSVDYDNGSGTSGSEDLEEVQSFNLLVGGIRFYL